MELLEIVLILLVLIIVSAVVDTVLPRVSLPLVQMGLGVLVGLFSAFPLNLTGINADLFLVMFIAPLLFDESRNADNAALWANMKGILSLAIGLVIAITLCVGFALNILHPSIPLAAAFALGAALGPTDAVAVAALGSDLNLTRRQKSQLSGEALLNDASGVVSFQFAIAAAVTGTFSVTKAAATFCIDFVGGIFIGMIIAIIYLLLLRYMRRLDLESTTIHILSEIVLPFGTYLICEHIGVSGILGVVACGLLVAFLPQKLGLIVVRKNSHETRTQLVSRSLWKVFSFSLNGIVFLFLGITLVQTIGPLIVSNDLLGFFWLIGVAVLIALVTEGVRYVWILATNYISKRKEGKKAKKKILRESLVTTLAGPKGAVTLSIILTIPVSLSNGDAFPERDLILFIASTVIIITLLLANFVTPLLAPAEDNDETDQASYDVQIRMMQRVIKDLNDGIDEDNKRATRQVVRAYQRRIAAMRKKMVPNVALKALRLEILDVQQDYIEDAARNDDVDARIAKNYLKRIEVMRKRIKSRYIPAAGKQNKPLASNTSVFKRMKNEIAAHPHARRNELEFKVEVEREAVRYLKRVAKENDELRVEAANALLAEHLPLLQVLKTRLVDVNQAEGIPTNFATELNATGAIKADGKHSVGTGGVGGASGTGVGERSGGASGVSGTSGSVNGEHHGGAAGGTGVGANVHSEHHGGVTAGGDSSGAGAGGPSTATINMPPTAAKDLADRNRVKIERTRSGRLKKREEVFAHRAATIAEIQAEALRLELEQIQEMRDNGRISRSQAQEMRADVYLQQMGLSDL